ncbi:hypothetical protein [uncultured Selenomonas sp.]|uniref:hypothetical protein n=1 Tax=uncultured Selenomonas sp. TaxID=159275 RepID=UPI0028047ADE|nr:hypothetical protein [uncultured Selenomonas sp.]
MSSITGAGFTSGAVGAGLNEAVIKEIAKIPDPGTAQIVSAIVGAAAAKAVGGTAGAGSAAAASGTKNNLFWFVPIFAGAIGETALAGIGTELLIAGGAVVGAVGAYVIIDSFGNPIARFKEETGQWVSEATGAPIQNISTYIQNVFQSSVKKKTVDGLSEYELPEVIVYGNKSKIRGEANKNNTTILPKSGAIFITPPTDIKKPKVEKTPPIGDDKWRKPYIENMPITEEQGAQTTAHPTLPPVDFRIPPTSTGILTGPMIYAGTLDQDYPKSDKHTVTKNRKDFGPFGPPNSSKDRIGEKGNILTRRWYDEKGRAYRDVDFTNHGNPRRHPKVPHEHRWYWNESGKPIRK